MLRSYPHGEDHGAVAGGDTSGILSGMGVPIPFEAEATPPDVSKDIANWGGSIENAAAQVAAKPEGVEYQADIGDIDFLGLVREAEQQALLYVQQANRRAWSQSYRAFHNEHFVGSKYTRPDWRGRSKLFVPKTRAAVRKDNAAVAASLFNNIDAINCLPGDESDPRQRAAAALMEEVVNYRVGGRAPGKASLPWFLVAMGARQDAVLTGVCCTKQYWLQTHRKVGEERYLEENEEGVHVQKVRDVYVQEMDRPDAMLIPPENYVIDPSADWRNPEQSAAFFIIKWPMQMEEIRAKMDAPVNPWNRVSEDVLRSSVESTKYDMAAIRRARELGLDRLDETQTGTHFQVIWVYEVFVRTEGEDYTFYSVGDKDYLTDPKPTRATYPEQHGDRPLALGYGNLESHRIFPMSPVESWQPLQIETNDLRNLLLDATKQNVMPISKIRRGRQIDLDQVKRRSSGSSIIVQEPDDVTWETPPQVPATAVQMTRELDLELDDLAGQQNYGSVETNNALGKTLGGLKLAAGAANAVQEFDIRVWIETWATKCLQQIVRLEQYYESDPIVLGICGAKAELWKKHGISQIDDSLMEQDVTVRVSVGLGAGDPQQRLAKFETAARIVAPILMQAPDFQQGKRKINVDAICEEVFGACGYKDGGARFFEEGEPQQPDPMLPLRIKELEAKISKDNRTGQAALFGGIAQLAKVALGKRELEAEVVDALLSRQIDARNAGFEHAHRKIDQHLAATDHGHRHGLALAGHRHQVGQDMRNAALEAAQPEGGDAESAAAASSAPPKAAPASAAPQGQPSASPPPVPQPDMGQALMALLQNGEIEFVRDPQTDRLSGLRLKSKGAHRYPTPRKAA